MHPVSALNFKAGKIELDYIQKRDLPNYDSLKLLARQSFCDFLIEKKTDFKTIPEYDLIKVLARRKWFYPNYIFSFEAVAVPKNTSAEEVAKKVFEISSNAANVTREKILECAKAFIR